MRVIRFLPTLLVSASVWVLMFPTFVLNSPYRLTYAALAWAMAVTAAVIQAALLDMHAQRSGSEPCSGGVNSQATEAP